MRPRAFGSYEEAQTALAEYGWGSAGWDIVWHHVTDDYWIEEKDRERLEAELSVCHMDAEALELFRQWCETRDMIALSRLVDHLNYGFSYIDEGLEPTLDLAMALYYHEQRQMKGYDTCAK